MNVLVQRTFIFVILVGSLAVKPSQVSGLTSIELLARQSQEDWHIATSSRRLLKDTSMELMTGKTSASKAASFVPNQSSKRQVRGGSDPIHNRDLYSKVISIGKKGGLGPRLLQMGLVTSALRPKSVPIGLDSQFGLGPHKKGSQREPGQIDSQPLDLGFLKPPPVLVQHVDMYGEPEKPLLLPLAS
ncbi:hypothetical protein NL676_037631 [Syzygium grande]|nr:hypothetical protein NL676_037631 [Syzygium grande]